MNTEKTKLDNFNSKFNTPNLLLTQLLIDQHFVPEFRSNNLLLHKFLHIQHYKQMIDIVTIVGSDDDKLRSYQFPQLVSQILSSQHPKIFQMIFLVQYKQHFLIHYLMDYFKGEPNYVLSGYVIKILNTLYRLHCVEVQQYLITNKYIENMIEFIASRSVSQFIIKFIVVDEDRLLNKHFDSRDALFNKILGLYQKEKFDEQKLLEANFIIVQFITKIFTVRHKQLGRFSTSLFKILEITISTKELKHRDTIIQTIIKFMSVFFQQSAFLKKKILIIILKELFGQSNIKNQELRTSYNEKISRFTIRRFRILRSFQTFFNSNLSESSQIFQQYNVLQNLLDLLQKYEWNNLVHIEIEKIFKHILTKQLKNIFINPNTLPKVLDKIITLVQSSLNKVKFGKGFSTCIFNIAINISKFIQLSNQAKQVILKHDCNFVQFLTEYIRKQESMLAIDLAGYKVGYKLAIPKYSQQKQLQRYKDFLISEQVKSQTLGTSQIKQLDEQIQSQNQMNKLLSIIPAEPHSQERDYIAQIKQNKQQQQQIKYQAETTQTQD